MEKVNASVLHADIVGFTLLTDRMVKSGIGGAEQLAEALGRVADRMTGIAWELGGELAGWEGDAATFAWFPREGLSLEDATLLAVQAALAIHREAANWTIDGAPLRFRSAVSSGELHHFEIGGRDDEWHAVLAGPALTEVMEAEKRAAPGQVILSPRAAALVGARCQSAPIAGDGAMLALAVLRPAAPAQSPPTGTLPWSLLRKAAPQVLLSPGHRASLAKGEFRVVTAVYAGVRNYDRASPEAALRALQEATRRAQACFAQYEGQIYQVRADENGITLIVMFGLPPVSREDDAARAVTAALALHREWAELGLSDSAGIATGRIFCGAFSLPADRDVFALVGPVMNLAARLMQLDAGVVCDEATKEAGRQPGRIAARRLTPRLIKGMPAPITTFAPYEVGGEAWQARPAEVAEMIGREREIADLLQSLAKLDQGGGALIEGEAGIGKTTLINRLKSAAAEAGVTVLAGAGDSTDQLTAYLAWRRVFSVLIQAKQEREKATGDRGPASEALARRGPLVDDMLGKEFRDNGDTAPLRGQARADALAQLLIDLLREEAGRAPLLLVIEDMHWLDPTSLQFFVRVAEARLPLMLVGSVRDLDAVPDRPAELGQIESLKRIRLEPANGAETGQILARALGASSADDDLAAAFRIRTGGNPLFVEELARMALANQVVRVDDMVRSASALADASEDLDDMLRRQGLPSTIEGVVRGGLDTLSDGQLSVLRAASVAGQSFSEALCAAGTPSLPRDEVAAGLAALVDAGVLDAIDSAQPTFAFRHAVLRDVVYNAMSFAERRQIHGFVGAWIEEHPQAEDVSAALARHFVHAGRPEKAVRYLIASGEAAARGFSNAEAAAALTRALELDRALREAKSEYALEADERARVSLLLGNALFGLSRYGDCRLHIEAGLRLAGLDAPASTAGVVLGLLRHIAAQVRHHYWPSKRSTPEAERARLRNAILGFESLAEVYFYQGDELRTLHAAMSTLNLSEALGPSPELARGCATLSGVASLLNLQRLTDYYATRALDIQKRVQDPAADIWVALLLGLVKLGDGEWDASKRLFGQVATAAARIGDRRRWRDGVENAAIAEACRGNWAEALVGLSEMLASARQDKDQRYVVLAYRAMAYCYLQLGDNVACEDCLQKIRVELGRGLTAEEQATRQDLHAMAATLALERGDRGAAALELDAALQAISQINSASSFPNMYWTLLLVCRVSVNLRATPGAEETPGDLRGDLRGLTQTCRALSTKAKAHRIAAPSAGIALGYLARLQGRPARAPPLWTEAASKAERLGLSYEARLARAALGVETSGNAPGLPFLIRKPAAHELIG